MTEARAQNTPAGAVQRTACSCLVSLSAVDGGMRQMEREYMGKRQTAAMLQLRMAAIEAPDQLVEDTHTHDRGTLPDRGAPQHMPASTRSPQPSSGGAPFCMSA